MGIQRMTFVDISGDASQLDNVLEACLSSGLFQPDNAAKLSEHSVGAFTIQRNPFGGLLVKISEISNQLRIPLGFTEMPQLPFESNGREDFIEQTHQYLDTLLQEYPAHFIKKKKLSDEMDAYAAALNMLGKVTDPDINFDKLFGSALLKIRFGKLPARALASLEAVADNEEFPFAIHPLLEEEEAWCIYSTAPQFVELVDKQFRDAGFTRLRIPDFVHGTTSDAISFLIDGIAQEHEESCRISREIDAITQREQQYLVSLYTRAKFLYEAYDLRKYVVSFRGLFHVIGFVRARDKEQFLHCLDHIPDITAKAMPAQQEPRLKTPVQLKNNWFVRPFEMFVNMYGTPSYNDIDPTPFVAYTYTLLFGVMFGDVGQGLCIFLLGLFLTKAKGMELGGIMSRIGIASAVFGVIYGSVFGFEHALDPFYHALGFHEKPIEVMHPDTTVQLLLAAVGLGAAIILMVIIFNICIGLKQRDHDRIFLSHNGLAGFLFYSAALNAAVQTMMGRHVLTTPYILCFLVFPLAVIFFREPIHRVAHIRASDVLINQHANLKESTTFKKLDADLPALFTAHYLSARFGRIPIDSYHKLRFYEDEPFVLYMLKTDREYIWCIYTMPYGDKAQVDAIFQDLFFERIYIPDADLTTNARAEAFIKACIEWGDPPAETGETPETGRDIRKARHKSIRQYMFPDGIGAFFTESFFELFEVLLSYVTNTMSFLRVGGFILSHAGMMSVVFTLSEMVGAGASPVVIVAGNLFVMGLEGLIVGIQALRLEFYEIFSRFFDAEGEPFVPAQANYEYRTG